MLCLFIASCFCQNVNGQSINFAETYRPQTPIPPFPYECIDTIFTANDGIRISSTITLPSEARTQKVPCVIFVSGSGPQNRDEEIMGHKPFAVIADYLARNGVASLRYDDRGTAKSEGEFNTGTTFTFRDDAISGINFLRTLPYFDSIGVIGHSEGGTISFMIAGDRDADFIISLAGMATTGRMTLLQQDIHSLDLMGIKDEAKENSILLIEKYYDRIESQYNQGIIEKIDIEALIDELGIKVPDSIIIDLKHRQELRTIWFDTLLCLNPASSIRAMTCPALVINGGLDTQVDAKLNTSIIRSLAPDADIRIIPRLNHLMQQAITGEGFEYGQIQETISPVVLEIIVNFILKHHTRI